MSTEEIIRVWKTSGKLSTSEGAGNAPENPAGEQGLSDEELELVEGGGSVVLCTNGADCSATGCPHTD